LATSSSKKKTVKAEREGKLSSGSIFQGALIQGKATSANLKITRSNAPDKTFTKKSSVMLSGMGGGFNRKAGVMKEKTLPS